MGASFLFSISCLLESAKPAKLAVNDQAIRDAVDGGMSFRKAAEALKVSLSTVQRVVKVQCL